MQFAMNAGKNGIHMLVIIAYYITMNGDNGEIFMKKCTL